MNPLFWAVTGFLLVLIGAIAGVRPAHRGAGVLVGTAALACAAVLAWTEARWALAPARWLFSIGLAFAALAHLLRAARAESNQERSEVR